MISEYICKEVALRLELPLKGVKATIELLDEGATVPFISRYRKERTGSFDEVAVRSVESMLKTVRELVARKEFVEEAIRESGGMTPDIARRLSEASSLTEVEDIYAPFKPKKRTRATIARLWQKL
jgi:uncharacterized protein